MSSLRYSDHARVRMQQRGIQPGVVESLLEFGDAAHDHRGGTIYYFSRAASRRTRSPALQRILEESRKVYAVVSEDQVVVTVGHRTKRIRRVG
jgi:hypothetical protein